MLSNENQILDEKQKARVAKRIATRFKSILQDLGFQVDNDPQMEDTPNRWAKMMVQEVLAGSFSEEPKVTVFPNTRGYDQMVFFGPIEVKSLCSHHFQPFLGEAFVAYIPNKEVCGISKLSRIVHWFMRRPQIQEELTKQIADYLDEKLNPLGVAVFIKSNHLCAHVRGVEEHNANMITSDLRGVFKEGMARHEFLHAISNSK